MPFPAVNSVSFSIKPGEIVGIVGESGSGKTTLARTIIGMLSSNASVTDGAVLYNGRDLLGLNKKEKRSILGTELGIITQESLSSLNPVRKIGSQFIQLICEKMSLNPKDAKESAISFLNRMNCPADIMSRYPFQLSGGQRQRVLIAMAFALCPKLLIADEPTTALDVTIQSQVLGEMMSIKDTYNTAIMLISHNLGVISQICDNVAVMYGGCIVEYGSVNSVLLKPSHPYTAGLINCIPGMDSDRSKKLYAIPEGEDNDKGCVFYSRCTLGEERCGYTRPALNKDEKGVFCACFL